MKKYSICLLLLFLVTGVSCFLAGFLLTRYQVSREQGFDHTVIETETVTEGQPVANVAQIEPVTETSETASEQEYYLVSEAGFLLVFLNDRTTICLYTHIPITDFPQKERERLMEGIWFPTMMDVFNYLESYTS